MNWLEHSYQRYPLVNILNKQVAIENGPVEIVDIFPLKRVIFHSYGTVYQRVLLKWGHPCGDEMFFPAPMAHPAAKSGHSLKKETPETNFLLEKSGQFDICASSSQALRSSTLVGGFNHLEKYQSMGRIIPYIVENKKCLKPPTST